MDFERSIFVFFIYFKIIFCNEGDFFIWGFGVEYIVERYVFEVFKLLDVVVIGDVDIGWDVGFVKC